MDSAGKSVTRAAALRNNVSRPSRRKRSDAKRDKIVWAAAKLFLAKGYDSVSINDIIVVVGGLPPAALFWRDANTVALHASIDWDTLSALYGAQ